MDQKKLQVISPLQYRILEISKKYKLSHLSSNLTAVDIIDEIYTNKRPEDIFVLSAGHAGLALYANLEKHERGNAENLYLKHRTHPTRDLKDGIHASAGSLGCGITLALGMAMADKMRNVYCLTSDGESWEPDVAGVLNLRDKFGLTNFHVYVNLNNYTCIENTGIPASIKYWTQSGCKFPINIRNTEQIYNKYPFLKGVQAHYYQLTDDDWTWIQNN